MKAHSTIVNPKATTAFKPTSPLTAVSPKRITKNKDASKKSPHPLAKAWYACRIDTNGIVKVYYDKLLTAVEGAAVIEGSTMSLISESDLAALPRKPRREQWLPIKASRRFYALYSERNDAKWHDKHHRPPLEIDANRQFVIWATLDKNGKVTRIEANESYMGWWLGMSDDTPAGRKAEAYRCVVSVPEAMTTLKPPKPIKAVTKGGAK